jgi:hypothetical protein
LQALSQALDRYGYTAVIGLVGVEGFGIPAPVARQGKFVVPVARFVDGLRQPNGIVAGLAQMPWWRFLGYNALGATVGLASGSSSAIWPGTTSPRFTPNSSVTRSTRWQL